MVERNSFDCGYLRNIARLLQKSIRLSRRDRAAGKQDRQAGERPPPDQGQIFPRRMRISKTTRTVPRLITIASPPAGALSISPASLWISESDRLATRTAASRGSTPYFAIW